jgi:predicted ferric reductase
MASNALLTTRHPLIENVLQTVDHFPFHGWKSPEIAWGEIWTVWRMF